MQSSSSSASKASQYCSSNFRHYGESSISTLRKQRVFVCYDECMKLYLSSIDVPTPKDLEALLGKPLRVASVAIIPNAQDYYSERARIVKNNECVENFEALGLVAHTVDLRSYSDALQLKKRLENFDIIWARGGNTFCLRYEMRRSGFEQIIKELLENGVVYGGDSAGALVAGTSIIGIESADIPEFAEEIIEDGLGLVPYVILPHIDIQEFEEAANNVKQISKSKVIGLRDSQAVIFIDDSYRIVDSL